MTGITELVSKIGDDNVKLQFLDSAATKMNFDHKKGTYITFGTDQPLTPTGTKDFGVVLWLPRTRVKEILGG